jgi:hypothetical protein
VATEAPKTIGEAIEDVTEEDLNAPEEDVDDDEVDETTDDDADDSDDANDDEDDSDDDTSDDEDDSDESDDDDDSDDDESGNDWGVDDDSEDEDTDFFDDLSQEQLAKIKKHPELNTLRKQLMKGYDKKATQHANLVKLGEAYRKNPLGVLQAIADQMGLQVVKRGDDKAAATEDGKKEPSKVEVAAGKLEKLFGEKAGPSVKAALMEFVDAVNDEKMEPVNEKLSKADAEAERARFLSEEASFRERHSKILTPEIENAVVKLGESGEFAPGKNQTAAGYLDSLLEVALARQGKSVAKDAGRRAGKKLREKIDRNKRDREPRGRGSKSGVRKVSRLEKEPESFKSMSEAIEHAAAEMEDDFEE